MRAVVYSHTGGREVLRLVERPVREPGPGEVRVKMQVSGVNPTDWKARRSLVGAVAIGLTGSASAQSEQASCVGVYSSYYAHGGGGTHRSEVAQDFAKNAQPAGRNVYSQVAGWDECP